MLPIVPLFEQRANATFACAKRIFTERGDTYGDTWRHCQHLALRAVYKELFQEELPREYCDAIAAAVLVDAKYQRLEGGWKSDHAIDGINYSAYLVDKMREVDSGNTAT